MRFDTLRIFGVVMPLICVPACSVAPPGNDNNTPPANANDNHSEPPTEFRYVQAFGAADAGFLSAVWGSGADDVFVGGGQADAGEIYHYDGQDWSQMAIPATDALVWVFGFAADDVFAVGEGGGILHYDGTRWARQTSHTTEDLWGVWGAAPDDVWAVGGSAGEGEEGVVILHYDGAGWSAVAPPQLDREASSLFKVWGAAADRVFAVGSNGLIVEYDGIEWAQILVADVTDDIIALWGTDAANIVAVGGRQQGVILRYDGTGWTGGRREGVEGLNGVFMPGPHQAVIVGVNGEAGVYDLLSDTYTRESSGTSRVLHAVWSDETGRDYVVGGDNRQPATGIALVRTLDTLPDNPSPPQPPPVNQPAIELGVGVAEGFMPLADGDDIQVFTAGQGGTHVFLTYRGFDFADEVGARLTVSVVDDTNSFQISGPSTFTVFLQDEGQGFYEQERLVSFRVGPTYITGQTATFTVTLAETASERSATVTASYRLVAP
jgi:hypothetical protein